jgi:hypothetical protein
MKMTRIYHFKARKERVYAMNKIDKRLEEKELLTVDKILMVFSWLYKSKIGTSLTEERAETYKRSLYETDIPCIVDEKGFTFWVDKYYVAVSNGRSTDYLYITKDFLIEEIKSLENALQRNYKVGLTLLGEIKKMSKKISQEYYLEPSYQGRLTKFEKYKQVV